MIKENKTIKEEVKTVSEMRLITPQFVNITRSFSHKLVPENHGINGHRFAPLDFFASYGDVVPQEEATPERLLEVSERLYNMARTDVERSIKRELEAMSNPDELLTEDLNNVALFVKMIADGRLDEATSEILAAKDKNILNDKQLTFLRKLLSEKKNG